MIGSCLVSLHFLCSRSVYSFQQIIHIFLERFDAAPCASQGECGEGFCEIGRSHPPVKICKCDEGFIDRDGKPCSYPQKSKQTAFNYSILLGVLGADWFYLAQGSGAYIFMGILKLLFFVLGIAAVTHQGYHGWTRGPGYLLPFVWGIVDVIRIVADSFYDGNGVELVGRDYVG